MNIVFLGAPGSGKGTQSVRLEKELNLIHISTGDIFRAAIKEKTEAGILASKYINDGKLVPDEVTLKIVEEFINSNNLDKGFIFDGFPRTLKQAEIYDQLAIKINQPIDKVIYLKVDEDKLLDRISGRRVCPKCGASYHITTLPPIKEGICDNCGSELIIRKDDNKDSLKVRLDEYNKQTAPLIEYYKSKNKLVEINAMNDLDQVYKDIINSLGE